MRSKFAIILAATATLLVGCVSSSLSTQKVPTELINSRAPTSSTTPEHICSDDANAGLEVVFDAVQDEPARVTLKNAKVALSDTNLLDETYLVKSQSQTSSTGETTLKIVTFYPTNRTSDSFFFQVATSKGEKLNSIKAGKLSIRNSIAQIGDAKLVCCSGSFKPIHNQGAWYCQ